MQYERLIILIKLDLRVCPPPPSTSRQEYSIRQRRGTLTIVGTEARRISAAYLFHCSFCLLFVGENENAKM